MKARISILEQKNVTSDALKDTPGNPDSSLVMPEVLVVEEVAAAPENMAAASTIEGYKCRRIWCSRTMIKEEEQKDQRET